MNNLERRDQQILYISDDAVFEEQKKCQNILQKLNFMDRADFAGMIRTRSSICGGCGRRAMIRSNILLLRKNEEVRKQLE